jgi:Fe-S oxidoreductase
VLQEMLDGRTVTDGYRSPEVLDALDLCLGCKGCRTDCPVGVDMAAYKTEFLYHHYKGRLRPRAHYALGWLPLWARMAAVAPRLVNRVLAGPLAPALKRLGGIAAERDLPPFARSAFSAQVGTGSKTLPGAVAADGRPAVVLWADTFTENFAPEIGMAAVSVLRSAGFRVLVPPRQGCCGLTWISTGQLGVARRVLGRTLDLLEPALAAGLPIVVLEPSCAVALRTELPEVLPDDSRSRRIADSVLTLAEFLTQRAPDWRPVPAALAGPRRRALVQIHCHQYATGGPGLLEIGLLDAAGVDAEILDTGCCGLAGDFGVVEGHYEVSMAVAELGLLPAVRAASADTLIIADGFSCRTQIAHGVPGRRAVHLAEVLAAGLDL